MHLQTWTCILTVNDFHKPPYFHDTVMPLYNLLFFTRNSVDKWRVTANDKERKASLQGDENILELGVMVTQLFECTENH